MARLQLLTVVVLWLLVLTALVRTLIRPRPHRHWMAGLEALAHMTQSAVLERSDPPRR